jgi:hypothetical protein
MELASFYGTPTTQWRRVFLPYTVFIRKAQALKVGVEIAPKFFLILSVVLGGDKVFVHNKQKTCLDMYDFRVV